MLKTLLSLIKKWKLSFEKTTKEGKPVQKSHKNKSRSKIEKHNQHITEFQKQAIEIITNHLNATEYAKHRLLMKEINFLLHYTFSVLEDDFYKGDKFLQSKITKIDDYVFSQYRNALQLEHNIKKLTTLAFSNRFDEDPKENLLAYFVFIEETGFEIIMLLNDFYDLLLNNKNKSKFSIGLKRTFSLDKNYAKDFIPDCEDRELGKYETLMTQDMTQLVTPTKAKRKIIEDVLKNENLN